MKLADYANGSSHWRVACDCSDSNHDVSMWFEPLDKDYEDVSLMVELEYGAHERWGNFFKRWPWRISTALKILFTGHYTFTSEVILNKDGLDAMKLALENGLRHHADCMQRQEEKKKVQNTKKD